MQKELLKYKIFYLGALFFALLGAREAHANPEFADRLVISINNISFSQRHLEVYLLIREALRSKENLPENSFSAQNWRPALDFFRDEMVIFQEAVRGNTLLLDKDALQKLSQKLQNTLRSNSSLQKILQRRQVSATEISRVLSTIVTTEAMRRSRMGQQARQDKSAAPSDHQPWIEELRARCICYFYEGALQYVPLL